jgi:hypothetical protein
MKRLISFKWVVFLLLFCFALGTVAHAKGIILRIYPGAVQNKDGGDAADPELGVNIELFRPSIPGDPTSTANIIADAVLAPVMEGPTLLYYQYENMSFDGGSVGVRVWKGTINAQGSWYGTANYACKSGAEPPPPTGVTSIKTTHRADVPYAPTIGSITEAMLRVGDSLELTLTIPVSYDPDGPDGIKTATGKSVAITYPTAPQDTQGATVTRPTGSVQLRARRFLTPRLIQRTARPRSP